MLTPAFPDPLTLEDGRSVTSAHDWHERRVPELRQLFQDHVYGRWPGAAPLQHRADQPEASVLGGAASAAETELTSSDGLLGIHLLVVRPTSVVNPPCILALNWAGNADLLGQAEELAAGGGSDLPGWWPLREIVERGYALASFHASELVADDKETAETALARFAVESGRPRGRTDTATLAAWAWGLSRSVDFLIDSAVVDPTRLAVFGHSRHGKAALVAGAMDERFSVVLAPGSGCGGAAPWRVGPLGSPGRDEEHPVETLETIVEAFPHWFCRALPAYKNRSEELPIDQHELMALSAPRPVLLSNAAADYWAYADGQFSMLHAAAPVYRLFVPDEDVVAGSLPPISVLDAGRLGWWMREGTHSVTTDDWHANLDYLDTWLR